MTALYFLCRTKEAVFVSIHTLWHFKEFKASKIFESFSNIPKGKWRLHNFVSIQHCIQTILHIVHDSIHISIYSVFKSFHHFVWERFQYGICIDCMILSSFLSPMNLKLASLTTLMTLTTLEPARYRSLSNLFVCLYLNLLEMADPIDLKCWGKISFAPEELLGKKSSVSKPEKIVCT